MCSVTDVRLLLETGQYLLQLLGQAIQLFLLLVHHFPMFTCILLEV